VLGGGGRVEGFSMLPGIMCRVKLEATGFGLYLNVQVLLEAASSTGKKPDSSQASGQGLWCNF